MRCGEIWLAPDGENADARLRPVVVIEPDENANTVAVCALTTTRGAQPGVIALHPDGLNGLNAASQVRVDLSTTLPKSALLRRLGVLAEADCARLKAALSHLRDPSRNPDPNDPGSRRPENDQ